jgi:hypothetical protein
MSRMHTGKQNRLTLEEKDLMKESKQKERDKYEQNNMGKYILLYPISEKVKKDLIEQNKVSEIQNDQSENIPDQSILNTEAEVTLEAAVKKKETMNSQKDQKSKLNKKKTMKEQDNSDGDIYLKYLKKANTIWEDFTTGKKKVKEESSDDNAKRAVFKKTKSVTIKSKVDNLKPQPKVPANKTAALAAVPHCNSVKKKTKKTILNQEDDIAEPRKMIITTKTQIVAENGNSKQPDEIEKLNSIHI